MSVKRRLLHGLGQGLQQGASSMMRMRGMQQGQPDLSMQTGIGQIGNELSMNPGDANTAGLLRMLQQLLNVKAM